MIDALIEKPSSNKLVGHAKYPMRTQAEKYVAARANRGKSKASGAILRSDRTVLRYQGDLGRAAEFIQEKYAVTKLKDITQEQAQAYIDKRLKEKILVRTVQGYAKALELLPLVSQLTVPSRTSDHRDKPKKARAYTREQIQEIQQNMPPAAHLAAQIILESGCRTKDFASIRLATERPLKNARSDKLLSDRFLGREDWIKVTFVGKGGHEYMSTISPQTAQKLECYRLFEPRDFRERKQDNVVATQCYDLPAGFKLSKCWSETCLRTFFVPRGIHGVRHSFAQERLKEMLKAGMTWDRAEICVSQQMGHYRAEQVKVYLR